MIKVPAAARHALKRFITLLLFAPIVVMASAPIKQLPPITEKFVDVSGQTVDFGNGAMGSLYVFTSEHCPLDKEWQSEIAQILNFARTQKIRPFLVNPHSPQIFDQNSKAQMMETKKNLKLEAPYILDNGKILKAFRVSRTPSAYLFNSRGLLTYFGKVDTTPEQKNYKNSLLYQALTNITNGATSSTVSNTPLGCRIQKGE